MADKSFSVRSISMPSITHPIKMKFKEELQNLQTSQLSTSASSTELMCWRLATLGGLYSDIQNLLCLSEIQQSLSKFNQRKWLEDEIAKSLAVLEFCSTMKDSVIAIKEHVQDLQLSLQRKTNSSTKYKLQVFHRLTKETQKVMKNCSKHLPVASHESSDISEVIEELHEARQITVSVLLSVSAFMSASKTKLSRWSFASKVMLKRKIVCQEDLIELQCLDVWASYESSDIMAQNHLEGIQNSLAGFVEKFEILVSGINPT